MNPRIIKRRRAAAISVVAGVIAFGAIAAAVTGNIDPQAIEIDGPPGGADLYPDLGVPLNAGAQADWVADNLDNVGTGCLAASGPNAGIATCNEANVSAAPGGTGHWNGVRIVDGIAGGDQDIFTKGGKEDDTDSWVIAPGSVGSSKYDITQAYLANNATTLFFGMERRGNNGTTAFDFEFNALAPSDCGNGPLVPCRSPNDVLFTFEMQGSGNAGSATAHLYLWDGDSYNEGALPAGAYTSINQAPTPAGPWGYVDSKGLWTTGQLDRFEFAESAVPVGGSGVTLPGVNPCGGSAYVQVRTRSSSTATSDLKDTTKVFHYVFAGLTATASKTAVAADGSSVTLTGAAEGATAYRWQVLQGTSWLDLAGATDATLQYGSFATHDTAPALGQQFTIGSDSYTGRIYSVKLRLHATKTVGTATCSADSAAVTVKQVVAADP